ncbi:hypothetical protein WJX72_000301 [[Myrmecia] bisecta]|uniref:Protein kinase domain-containing protein n=1 Tax=[Myrmecia] bisecta TaxID=41462 RepID=A0AAW1PWQ4_9CHLO
MPSDKRDYKTESAAAERVNGRHPRDLHREADIRRERGETRRVDRGPASRGADRGSERFPAENGLERGPDRPGERRAERPLDRVPDRHRERVPGAAWPEDRGRHRDRDSKDRDPRDGSRDRRDASSRPGGDRSRPSSPWSGKPGPLPAGAARGPTYTSPPSRKPSGNLGPARPEEPRRPVNTPPAGAGPTSALLEDLRKAAKEAQQKEARAKEARQRAQDTSSAEPSPQQDADAAQANGEAGAEPPAKRQKHAPIVWSTPGKKGDAGKVDSTSRLAASSVAAPSPGASPSSPPGFGAADRTAAGAAVSRPSSRAAGQSAASIAAAELEAFRARQAEQADLDLDAPAAMKASPSGSEDGEIHQPCPATDPAPGAAAEADDAATDESLEDVRPPGLSSRWHSQLDEPDEEEATAPAPMSAVGEVLELEALNDRERMEIREEDAADSDLDEPGPGAVAQRPSMLQSCRSVDEFERIYRISEGTYGVVYRAKDRKSGKICALKKIKMEKEKEGFPLTSIREINILLSFHHPNIVNVSEVAVGHSLDSVFMAMEIMDHDLKALMDHKDTPFTVPEVKCLMLQLLSGIAYLHDNWVLHRDLKTSNILYNNRGELKICDFGLARQYGSPLRPYTLNVVTQYYRAPELLLGATTYSTAIDIWSIGCIMAELLSKEVLFPGRSELDQLDRIWRVLGTPNENIWPGYSKLKHAKTFKFMPQPYNKLREKFPAQAVAFDGRPTLGEDGFDLLNKLLTLCPQKRISAKEALQHKWFSTIPLPREKELMPTFPVPLR